MKYMGLLLLASVFIPFASVDIPTAVIAFISGVFVAMLAIDLFR